jgi:dephospho-CoA kinase
MNYVVTGPICSGKSTLLKIAKGFGFKIMKSDDIVSDLYNDKVIVSKLMKVFDEYNIESSPKQIIKYLFFESCSNRKEIENIFHPKVHEIIENELLSNNNMLIELPPLKSNLSFIKNNKSIFIDSDIEIRTERFIERNIKDSIDIFHKMNGYQTDCLLIKSYCDIIIQNNKNKKIITDYFYKDIIKS